MKKYLVFSVLFFLTFVFCMSAFALDCNDKTSQLASYQSLITEYTTAKTDLENWLTPYVSKSEITIELLQAKINRHQAKINNWTSESSTASVKKITELEASISRYNNYISTLNQMIADRKAKVAGKSQRYKDEIAEYQTKIDETQTKYNELSNQTCACISTGKVLVWSNGYGFYEGEYCAGDFQVVDGKPYWPGFWRTFHGCTYYFKVDACGNAIICDGRCSF